MKKLFPHREDWVPFAIWATLVIVALGALRVLLPPRHPAPEIIIRIDTVYAPPPDFIDGFRLECRWLPDSIPEDEG